MAFLDDIIGLVAHMSPVTLQSIDGVSLFNRVDTKYVLREEQLREVLTEVGGDYQVLDFGGLRVCRYASTYFDTPDFAMYLSHHNGARTRYKVRCRAYIDSQLAFLEFKEKTNLERTIKTRVQIPELFTTLAHVDPTRLPQCFPYDLTVLRPVLWNRFRRLTFINLNVCERVTVDMKISFGFRSQAFVRERLVVAEVKQPKLSVASPFVQAMHRLHLAPSAFSKFCMATTCLYPALKQNRFKPLLLHLDRICPLRGCREPVD